MTYDPNASVPAVYMRGGTSKGIFLHAHDLPPAGHDRDDLLLRIMGSPDPLQIDGMGGTYSSTSKVVVVESGPDDAVTYWFAQVGIDSALVDWSGNCGNLTAAVAPFALQEQLVAATGETTPVRLVNANTGVHVEAVVRTPGGRVTDVGDIEISGVPGQGSPVITRYLDPAGGVLGSLLPLGAPRSPFPTVDGIVSASLVDAAHPNLIVTAHDVGVAPLSRPVVELNHDAALLRRIERLRGAATVAVGRATSLEEASRTAPAVPRIMLVAPAVDESADLDVLAFSMGRAHRGLPMTGALCLAAAASLRGTVVSDMLGAPRASLTIRHALGVTRVEAERGEGEQTIHSLGATSTARRLMKGRVYPRPRRPRRP